MKNLPITMMPDGWMEKASGYAKDMTLRDYFAAQAMQSILYADRVHGIIGVNFYEHDRAKDAYRVADAMLKAGQS